MKQLLKQGLFSVLDAAGAPNMMLALRRRQGFIALYHGVAPAQTKDGIYNYRKKFISPEKFDIHLSWLKSHFTVVPLSSFIEQCERGGKFQKPTVAITFDDGYENFYTHAYPALKRHSVPAAFFITTNLVEKKEPLWVDKLEYAIGHTTQRELEFSIHGKKLIFSLSTPEERLRSDLFLRGHMKTIPNEDRLLLLEEILQKTGKNLAAAFEHSPYAGLSWDQIREMAKSGFEFMPHTASHPILSKLTEDAERKEIIEPFELMKERMGNPLPIFAYPNGLADDFTGRTVSMLKKNGFRAALTAIPGTVRGGEDLFHLPRFALDGGDDLRFFRLTISGARKILQDARPYPV